MPHHDHDVTTTAPDPETISPALLREARDWIADCEWGDLDPAEIAHLSAGEIVRGIRQNYSGGWPSFIADGGD